MMKQHRTGYIAQILLTLLKAGKEAYCLLLSGLYNNQKQTLLLKHFSIILLTAITVFMLSAKVYSDAAYASVAPSTYKGGNNYSPGAPLDATGEPTGKVRWAAVTEDDETGNMGCPGDTKPEMSLGTIIGVALASGIAGALAMAIFTGVLLGISVYVFDGLRIACPPPHPDHPNLGAYWTHFGNEPDGTPKARIVFAYRPCLGFPVASSDDADEYKGVTSGMKCQGLRIGDGSSTANAWEGGEHHYLHGVFLGVKDLEDKLCLYMDAGISKLELTCQYKRPPPPPAVPQLACFMPRVCADANAVDQSKTKLPFSITATLVRCIEGTMDSLFREQDPDLDYYSTEGQTQCIAMTFMERFQLVMHRSVVGLLTLYIIFYGIKIAFGVQLPQRNEFFMKMLTFAMVSYFALGDGWKDYFHVLVDIVNTLAANIMDTTTSGGNYCDFPMNSYAPGYEHNKLWDTLDCKIMTYFFSNESYPKLFQVGAYSFFGGGILILLFGIVFAIFLVLILIMAVNVYIAAFIATSILVFLSPIFVPMILFPQTRKYFDGWLDEIVAFAAYPVILFGFIALMLVSFDTFVFNEKLSKTINADGSVSVMLTNPKNEWVGGNVSEVLCSLRDQNPSIKAKYASESECQTECWMYGSKLLDANIASTINENTDCDTLTAMAQPNNSGDTAIALCKINGKCSRGDYKPRFKHYCQAVERTFDTEADCHAYHISSNGATVYPCGQSDCTPLCDPEGFGCQLYKARPNIKGGADGLNVDRFEMGTALLALLKVLGIGVLFFHFLSVIGPMIAELTGNRKTSLQNVSINPHELMKKGMEKIAAAATSGASEGMKKAKDAVKRAGAGGGE